MHDSDLIVLFFSFEVIIYCSIFYFIFNVLIKISNNFNDKSREESVLINVSFVYLVPDT